MINKLLMVFAVIGLTGFSSCKKNFNDQPDYVGTWTNGANVVVLGSNNTYSVTAQSILISSGKYSAKQNVLSLTGTVGYCHDSLPATYTYVYTNTVTQYGIFKRNLSLTLDVDSCAARATVVPGSYTMPVVH